MKKIAILGSTGSIGTQTLDLIAANKDSFCVSALATFANKKLLLEQQRQFNVPFVGLIDTSQKANDGICYGIECLQKAILNADVLVVATRGIVALRAVLEALNNGQCVALANKEILVCAGQLIKQAQKQGNGVLLPVDSEHSALMQCLSNSKPSQVKRLILTASGGAFFGKDRDYLCSVTPKQALNHPRWNMGKKITIDSATLVNKGFEVIEAHWLFDMPINDIDVVVNPQSIVHSLVEYVDGSILAQMSVADMKLPISYALSYPQRVPAAVDSLNLLGTKLDFLPIDSDVFEGIDICTKAFSIHPLMPTVLNAADEYAVLSFLDGKINFLQIYDVIKNAIKHFTDKLNDLSTTLTNIINLDKETKAFCAVNLSLLQKGQK